MITRRDLLSILAAQWLTMPLVVAQPKKTWRLGFLIPSLPFRPGEPNLYGTAFVQEMQAQGYSYEIDYQVEIKSADGNFARLPALASELAGTVDVLVPISTAAARAAYQATRTVPIVFVGVHDPVGLGLAPSLSRPGGNITGVATFYGELIPKQMELLKAIAPNLSRIGILTNEDFESYPDLTRTVRTAAAALTATTQFFKGGSEEQIERSFAAMVRERMSAVIVVSDPDMLAQRQRIAQLAAEHRLASMFAHRENVVAGGLICYGESATEEFLMAARYVARVLKGDKPGDLPIEQPTTFELVINRGAARAIGLSIPQDLLVRAEIVDQPPAVEHP
jgi:putative ABC transport system substrate-binding protein